MIGRQRMRSAAMTACGGALILGASVCCPAADRVPEGRHMTDRSIVMNVVVECSIDEVYELWSTVEGTKKFFGEDAVIDLRPGGEYEIYFLPREDPGSDANSSKGAKLLWLVPGQELAFEWTMPPFAAELNVDPLPTWITIRVEALPDRPDRSHVRIAHHGFQRGGAWDRVYEFFVNAWQSILFRLDRHCALVAGVPPESAIRSN